MSNPATRRPPIPAAGGWVGDDPRITSSLPEDTLTREDLRPRWRGPGRL